MIRFLLDYTPEILNTVFTPLASFYLFHTFTNIKNKAKFLLALIAFTALYTSVNWFVEIMPIRLALTFICVFVLSLGFMMKTSYRFLLSGVFMAIIAIADVLAVTSQLLFFEVSISQTYDEPYFSLGVLQTFIIVFTALFLIHHAKHHQFTNTYSKKIKILYLLPLATILANWTEYAIVCNFDLSTGLELLLIANLFVLILTNFIVFYVSDNIYNQLQYEYKLRVAEELITQQSKKYASLIKDSEEIKRIKHDQRNFVLGAITELDQNKYETLKSHLNEQLEVLKKFSHSKSDYPIFDVIIEHKQKEAKKYGITITHDINALVTPQVDNIDFAIIIGNLLDNAIEATAIIENLECKTIDFFAEISIEHILISITNPVDKEIDVNQLNTSKPDPKNHGLGLLSVNKIVDKYSGSLILKCQDGIFEASIMLPQSSNI